MAGMADVIARLSVFLGLDTAAFEKGADVSEKRLKRMEREFEHSGKKLQDLGKKLTLAISAPVAAAGAAVLKMSGDFESSMIKLSISSQASAGELREMSELALKLGKDTIFGASDAANAMDELAKSGMSARTIIDGAAEAAVYLATATGSELSPAANAITDTMQQFGLATAQLPDAVNQITGAVNESKLDFQDYALAIGQAGGVAGGLGVDFTDFNTVLAATSSLFASGSDAGTSYKTFLTSLSGNSKQAKEAIAAFGLQFFDANGNMRSMGEIAEELRVKLGGLNDQAKTEVLKRIFGTDAMRTAIGLMQQGSAGLERMAEAIRKTDAAAQATERMKGFYGQLENLKGAIETLAIRIGQSGVLEAVTALVTRIGDLVDWLSEASPTVLRFTALIAGIAAVVGPTIFAIGLIKASLAPLYVALRMQIGPALLAFGWQIAAIATTAGPAAAALRLLTVALRGLLIATGVGAAIAALTFLLDRLIFGSKESADASKDLEEQAKNTADALDIERKATELLAKAKDVERKAMVESMKASHARGEQALRTAKKLQAEAKAALETARANALMTYEKSAGDTGFLATFGRALGGAGAPAPTITPGTAQATKEMRAVDAAQARLDGANREIARASSLVDGLGRAITNAESPMARMLEELGSGPSGATDSGTGGRSRGGSGRSAKEISRQFDAELLRGQIELEEILAGTRNIAEEMAAAAISRIRAEQAITKREIEADEEYDKAQKGKLLILNDQIAAASVAAIGVQEEIRLMEEAADLRRLDVEAARDNLRFAYDMADTQADRRRIALQMLDLDERLKRAELQEIIETEGIAAAKKERARRELAALDVDFANRRAAAIRDTESPMERYRREINMTTAQMSEAFESIRVSGLQSFNDQLADAIVNFKSLGDVARNVFKQMLADVIRLQLQKHLIAPLTNFLGGGSSGGGGSSAAGIASTISKIGSSIKSIKIPGFANGTSFAPGGLAWVGERGPELVGLPRGASVTPNNDLHRMGGNTYHISGNLLTPAFWKQIREGDIGAARAGAAGGVAQIARSNGRRYA